jgi:hypothetical protein
MVVIDEAAVLEVLDRFRRGWEALDAEAVLACFADDPQSTGAASTRSSSPSGR